MPAKKEHFCAHCGASIDVKGHMGRVFVQGQLPREFYLLNGRKVRDVSHKNVAPATKLCVKCAVECQHVIDEWVAKGRGANRD